MGEYTDYVRVVQYPTRTLLFFFRCTFLPMVRDGSRRAPRERRDAAQQPPRGVHRSRSRSRN